MAQIDFNSLRSTRRELNLLDNMRAYIRARGFYEIEIEEFFGPRPRMKLIEQNSLLSDWSYLSYDEFPRDIAVATVLLYFRDVQDATLVKMMLSE